MHLGLAVRLVSLKLVVVVLRDVALVMLLLAVVLGCWLLGLHVQTR